MKTDYNKRKGLICITKSEKLNNEYDIERYKKSIKEFNKNPKTYSLQEVKKELGL